MELVTGIKGVLAVQVTTRRILSCALVACGAADTTIVEPKAPMVQAGDQNTSVLQGPLYLGKSQGFSASDHAPFVEAGQMYFDGAGRHWGSSTINVDGF